MMAEGSVAEDPAVQAVINDILRYETLAEEENVQLSKHKDIETLTRSASAGERFLNVTEEETDRFLQSSANRNTSYKTKSDLKTFYDWAIHNNEFRKIENMTAEELDALLARFYLHVGARKRDGSLYEPDTLSCIQNSIDRHIRDLKLTFSLKTDVCFSHSRRVLEAKRKALKSMGKGAKPNKAAPLTKEEINILYQEGVLGIENPEQLLNIIWLNNGAYFGLRGRQDHTNLHWGDIQLKMTSDGKEYLEFNERSTKTRSGAKRGDYRRVTPKMFELPDEVRCPVKCYKEFSRHRPEDMRVPEARFYLRPLENPTSDVWFSHQPIGKQNLGTKMNRMAEKGGLQGRKVNHSTRKTFGTTLVQAGVPPTEVAHLGGWKNIQTINEYSVPSVEQQENTSNILSNIMVPHVDSPAITSQPCQPENSLPIHLRYITDKQSITTKVQHVDDTFTSNPLSVLREATFNSSTININIFPDRKRKLDSTVSLENSQETSNANNL